jgi:hypothetical protein
VPRPEVCVSVTVPTAGAEIENAVTSIHVVMAVERLTAVTPVIRTETLRVYPPVTIPSSTAIPTSDPDVLFTKSSDATEGTVATATRPIGT